MSLNEATDTPFGIFEKCRAFFRFSVPSIPKLQIFAVDQATDCTLLQGCNFLRVRRVPECSWAGDCSLRTRISVFGAEIQWKVGSRREQFEGEEVVVAFSLAAINGDSKGF